MHLWGVLFSRKADASVSLCPHRLYYKKMLKNFLTHGNILRGEIMCIDLEDAVSYIDSYSDAFFDPQTYTFYFAHSLPPALSTADMLAVPKIRERAITDAFVKEHEVLRQKNVDSISAFHKAVNDCGLHDAWIGFRFGFLSNVARLWCLTNRIQFSKK